ncbi:KR domain-containing protein [Nemania sp. NC0429]|nr:KR domain-containing protein [Nemania sp. NC0429]
MPQRRRDHTPELRAHTADVNPEMRTAVHLVVLHQRPDILQTLLAECCDISPEQRVRTAADDLVRQGAPPLLGVIQGAVVINDQLIEAMTHGSFKAAMKSKVDVTLILIRLFSSSDLAFVVSLSSLAGVLGASALASYNAGHNGARLLVTHFPATRRRTLMCASRTFNEWVQARFGWGRLVITTRHVIIGLDAESLATESTSPNGSAESALFSHVQRHGDTHCVEDNKSRGSTIDELIKNGDLEAVSEFIAPADAARMVRSIAVDIGTIDAPLRAI